MEAICSSKTFPHKDPHAVRNAVFSVNWEKEYVNTFSKVK